MNKKEKVDVLEINEQKKKNIATINSEDKETIELPGLLNGNQIK